MLLDAIALASVILIGFAAHRASLCNVRAVAEFLHDGNAGMLWSLLQAVLWMAALTGTLVLVFGLVPKSALERMPIVWAWAGGLLFGVGAAVNGGCSLSTLHRLADGNLGMLATLAGFVLGVVSWIVVMEAGGMAVLTPAPSVWLRWPDFAPWLLAALLFWVGYRLFSFWHLSRSLEDRRVHALVLAPMYHLSVAAAVLGISGGLLYATQGAWSYTNFLRAEVTHGISGAMPPRAWHAVLVAGLLAGMAASALQRRALAWHAPARLLGWSRHLGGGILMGAGAALIPGGNDTLLLSGLPSATAAAVGAYLCMLLGIAGVLVALRE